MYILENFQAHILPCTARKLVEVIKFFNLGQSYASSYTNELSLKSLSKWEFSVHFTSTSFSEDIESPLGIHQYYK